MKKTIATFAAVASALVSGAAFLPMASATTTKDVVKHTVWLRSSQSISRNGIERLQPGAVLTEEGRTSKWIHVVAPNGRTGYVVNRTYYVVRETSTQKVATSTTASSSVAASGWSTAPTTNFSLPPAVTYDNSITPLAGKGASQQAKADAVLKEAASKLGTPYIWGHNEDRGQYGFDCSNFTAYVYHHALGYKMSGSSQTQNTSVGWRVSQSAMRPGDLIIFENGGHCGIYVGNGEMINEGGGLGKVGYLSLKPGSYWCNHITAVKRMF